MQTVAYGIGHTRVPQPCCFTRSLFSTGRVCSTPRRWNRTNKKSVVAKGLAEDQDNLEGKPAETLGVDDLGFPSPMNPLDSTNVWDYKPAWCQPYTILLSGCLAEFFVYKLSSGSIWFSGGVGLIIGLWWYIFLIEYPKDFEMYVMEERERRKRSGRMYDQ